MSPARNLLTAAVFLGPRGYRHPGGVQRLLRRNDVAGGLLAQPMAATEMQRPSPIVGATAGPGRVNRPAGPSSYHMGTPPALRGTVRGARVSRGQTDEHGRRVS